MDDDAVRARLTAVRGGSDGKFDDYELRARLARLQGKTPTAPPTSLLPPRTGDAADATEQLLLHAADAARLASGGLRGGPASSSGYTELPPRRPEDEVEELLRAKADEVWFGPPPPPPHIISAPRPTSPPTARRCAWLQAGRLRMGRRDLLGRVVARRPPTPGCTPKWLRHSVARPPARLLRRRCC